MREVFHTWQGQNVNIPSSFGEPKHLASIMNALSQNEAYTSSYPQFELFCFAALFETSIDCFKSVFLYAENKIVQGFLNVDIKYDDIDIDYICVGKQYRQNHVAQKLFHSFENFIIEKKQTWNILLEVGVNNIPALTFYKKQGFKLISVRKKYYKNSEDALFMRKELKH